MSVLSDLRVLYHMVANPVKGDTHAERLDSFYAGQSGDYDDFRKRLLPGRQELWSEIPTARDGAVWIDMGGGTGSNLENFGGDITQLKQVYVVDLSRSLLDVAEQRTAAAGWHNVEIVEADATQFQPPTDKADVVTFSYSLTMIPDWFAAVQNAIACLRPGGILGVVDFYVARKYPQSHNQRHGWLTRAGWPLWFASDNVFLSPDHLPFLQQQLETVSLTEARGKVPYLPLVRVPYYRFVGRKPSC